MEGIFYRYNPWWEGKGLSEEAIERPGPMEAIQGQLRSRQVVFLSGLRRVGKTTLLKLLIKHLIEKEGVRPSHIFYVSLDDYLLSKKSILELVEEYRKVQRLSIKEKIFLFFDEITYRICEGHILILHKTDFLSGTGRVKFMRNGSKHWTF